ncbi:MAG: TolC family protein, partial [Bacteroidales bacterium]|nr:TolC family protein [Bacteroidales bacterium]
MNVTKWIIIPVLVCGSLPARSQASLDSLMNRVLHNNQTIIGAGQYYENARISSRTNLYPENPELEYAYLWGSPSQLGNRTDFAVSQSFEFPSVYTNRSKMSKAGVVKASQIVESIRQITLLETKQLWIEKVYMNRKQRVLKKRMQEADEVSNYFRKQFENGEISKLRYNKALLLQASLRSALDLLEAESYGLDTEIARISGNTLNTIEDQDYYLTDYAILDSVL